jgi:hypothetical protein
VDDFLTLEGLRIIWERNSAAKPVRDAAPAKIHKAAEKGPSKPWPTSKARTPR